MYTPATLRRRVGIIDLGSNSARLLVVAFTPGLTFRTTHEVSRRVRLSEGMAADRRLRPAAVARTVATLRMFRVFCEANGVKRIIPVATAAVRDASNRAEFLDGVRAAAGLRLRVLTGEAEAYYGALGAINGLGLRSGWVMEVGGGSAQVSEVRGGRFRRGVTSPLGAVRLTELYLGSDPVKPREAARLANHIAATFQTLGWTGLGPDAKIVGVGGTARALARIDREARRYPLTLVNGYELELSRLEVLVDRLRWHPVRERPRQVPGLEPDRADIILAGAMVWAGALRSAGADRLVVCGHGLREGLFFKEFLKPTDPPAIHRLREFSVLNLCRLYGCETAHAGHVARLALSLFDQLSARHGYGAPERECLWAAARLHELGAIVDYYDHPKHSGYIILSAGLPGYSHRETALIALLCRYHRLGRPEFEPYQGLMRAGDAERVGRLTALLRLAEYLDRGRAQTVTGLKAETDGNQQVCLRVRTRARGDARVEVEDAQRNADLFEEAFGCKLKLTSGG